MPGAIATAAAARALAGAIKSATSSSGVILAVALAGSRSTARRLLIWRGMPADVHAGGCASAGPAATVTASPGKSHVRKSASSIRGGFPSGGVCERRHVVAPVQEATSATSKQRAEAVCRAEAGRRDGRQNLLQRRLKLGRELRPLGRKGRRNVGISSGRNRRSSAEGRSSALPSSYSTRSSGTQPSS